MIKPNSKTARRPPPAGRDRDTEQRILDAAHRVFLRRGTAGARMQEIADEAAVNKALLHYYFRSKDEILFEVHRIGIEAITDGDTPMPGPGEGTGRERLHEFLRRYVRMVVDDFGTCLVMTGTNALEPENRAEAPAEAPPQKLTP